MEEFNVRQQQTRQFSLLNAGLALLIAFVLLLAFQLVSERRQIAAELEIEAAIIGANCTAALAFNDRAAAQEILEATRLSSRIVGGALYRADGTLLAVVNDPQRRFPARVPSAAATWLRAHERELPLLHHLIRQEIFQDRTPVGSLLLLVSYEPLYVKMLEYLIGMTAIGLLALFLTQRATAGLRRRMALTEEQLEQIALFDRVTGLPNRRSFERELRQAIERLRHQRKAGALMLMDIDDFKKVNDLCGHAAGDQLLLSVAERLRKTVRAQDIVARVGGDEFAVILYGIDSPERSALIAEAMLAAIAEPFPTQPAPSHVGISIGLTLLPEDGDDPSLLMRWSEMAMYEAKAKGKNRYQFFSEDINAKVRDELHIETALRKALQQHGQGLWVAYQPLVSAQTRQLLGVEALMRWTAEDGRTVSPGAFIPIAENTGLITELGRWLLERVCTDLAELRAAGIEIPKVSVNLSPRELREGGAIVDTICATLDRFGETRAHFRFEITENALLTESAHVTLDAMRKAGFSLAIDDFGSGYSSLGYLKRFHVGALKIDRQFIEQLPDDDEDAVIVQAVIRMSAALGISVVAEGVETEAQAEFLRTHGCEVLQGYLTGRPMAPGQLREFLRAAPPA